MAISCSAFRAPQLTSTILAIGILCSLPMAARGEWHTLTITDGLVENSVLTIMEDASGALWFGTPNGVSRCDGVSWTTYSEADGLPVGPVKEIYQDRSGAVWFSAEGSGATRFDGGIWTSYTTADGLASNRVLAILQHSSGDMWFATDDGVSRFDGVQWTTYRRETQIYAGNVTSILEDSAGTLWFGGLRGAVRYDGASWTLLPGVHLVNAMLEDRSGAIWFGTLAGAFRYDGETLTQYRTADGLPGDNVTSMAEDSEGDLWFGTPYSGVGRFDGTHWRTYTTDDGLPANSGSTILVDSSGLIWFGGFGATYWDKECWASYTSADGLPSDHVLAADVDTSGAVWIGTQEGAARFDGQNWVPLTTADGLASNWVEAILTDSSGAIWFGTNAGVSRLDGQGWTSFTTADGLAGAEVTSILQDESGKFWFGTSGGVSTYDGSTWRSYTRADGLADDHVYCLLQTSSGSIWAGGPWGVSKFQAGLWTRVFLNDATGPISVFAILEDRAGDLWFGTTDQGVIRYDGSGWTTYSTGNGLSGNDVHSIAQDETGALWFGTGNGGVSRFYRGEWGSYTQDPSGLPNNYVRTILANGSGTFWFGTWGGVARHEADRIAPRTVFTVVPRNVTTSRFQRADFSAAYGALPGTRFSYALDQGPWSAWSAGNSWSEELPGDGSYVLRVRSRDAIGNVDPDPASVGFEIDTRPPVPTLSAPVFGQAVRGTVAIVGTASDARFQEYRIQARSTDAGAEWNPIAVSDEAVNDGVLGEWNTPSVADGFYQLQLAVADSLGLVGIAEIEVLVDNEAPWADQTSPSRIPSTQGGDVFSIDGELHLYFPPNAFGEDATVTVEAMSSDEPPESLPDGAHAVSRGFAIAWGGAALEKGGRLEWIVPQEQPAELAVFVQEGAGSWRRLGGTVDPQRGIISAGIDRAGRYALYSGGDPIAGERTLRNMLITPRVFSPTGGFADRRAAISFLLGRPGLVTVKVYNRAGRLVREVGSDLALNAGANLLYWDGRNQDGEAVADGLYMVAVEALGEKQVKTLAVVR